MCGIAGIIGRIGDRNRAALKRMSDAMIHRGPDDQGAWESPPDSRGFGALLAHRRLAILDLSPAGAQPMVDPVSGHVIVYNGEICNFQELRERLSASGQTFASSGDTAVLVRALGLQGADAVASLRGMFAFASWDPQRRQLLLARDPLGMKPLYVACSGDPSADWSLAFASEVRSLLASGLLGKPRLRPEAAASVVWNGFVAGPYTAVEGIESLWPGELRVYGAGGKQELARDFWTVRQPGADAMDEERLSSILEECLRLHLISDVPLGVFLSGGVDSSAVANLAQKATRAPIHTFTLAFEEPEYNEGPIARQIAQGIGTQHREVVLTEERVAGQLDKALDGLDQPTFDGLNSYYMSYAVRQAGFTVALVETGGDELFGGYTSFRDLPRLHSWFRRLRWMPRGTVEAGARLIASATRRSNGGAIPPQIRWAKLPDMLRRGDDLIALYQLAYALFLPDFQRALIPSDGALVDGLPGKLRARLEQEIRERSPLSAISVLEQRLFLGERLLRDNDAASMAASIEQRLPLVDQVLVEAVSELPDGPRYQPLRQKAALRRIGLRGLDGALFDRPKSGFVLPFDRWIRRGLSERIDQTLRDPAAVGAAGLRPAVVRRLRDAFLGGARGLYWSRVWAVYVLVRWCLRNEVHR